MRIINYILVFCCFFIMATLQSIAQDEKITKTDLQYWTDGLYYYADRSYTSASEEFENLTHNYPYSQYAHNALLMEIYTNYINNEKDKIAGIAEVFYRLFPLDEDTPYVMYMQAMADFSMIKDEKTNLDKMVESEKNFKNLIQLYPESIYSKDAMRKIEFLDIIKQLNDLHSAEVFQKRKKYYGAMRRYTGLFNTYSSNINKKVEEIALCRLIGITKTLKLENESKKYKDLFNQKQYDINKCKYDNN